MSSITTSRKTALGLIGAALAGSVLLSGSAFAMQPLAQGYLVAASDAKPAEGKCGEGKCGTDATTQGKSDGNGKSAAAEGKCGEGKCGADAKSAEGKCGEGKCGADAKATQSEGKCGEGKCGDASFAKTDADGDGFVSRAEFLAVAPTRAAEFQKIDSNGDGKISEQEAYDYLKAIYTANGKPVPKDLFSKITG